MILIVLIKVHIKHVAHAKQRSLPFYGKILKIPKEILVITIRVKVELLILISF